MLTLLLSLLLSQPVDLTTSRKQAFRCETATVWSERVDGGWLAVCGDAQGRAIRIQGGQS